MSSAGRDENRVTLTDALEHAITIEYLLLFGLIVVGWVVVQAGTGLLAIGGFGAAFVGIVAAAYKLFRDSRAPVDDATAE
jgi:hypothetical protein